MRVQAPPPIIMEIIEVEQKKMEALRVLSDIQMRISKAREDLSNIDKEKDQYFADRETEVVEKIKTLLSDSQQILIEAGVNFDEVHLFAESVINFSDLVTKFHDRLIKIQELLEEKASEFTKVIEVEQKKAEAIKRELKIDRTQIENDRKALILREKELVKRETKVKDLEQMVQRDIIRLKEGRI